MRWARVAVGVVVAVAAAGLLVSGGSGADPRTPAGLPGLPPPFLGTAVVGSGGLTAAVDAYGDVVDLRPRPAGRALIYNPSVRQAAGTVAVSTGIVPRVRLGGGPALPLWRADSVRQRYLPGTNVIVTTARFHLRQERRHPRSRPGPPQRHRPRPGAARVRIVYAVAGSRLACQIETTGGISASLRAAEPAAARRLRCGRGSARLIVAAARGNRRWLRRARPLGPAAPPWARRFYERSLLVLRALTDRQTGAVAAGARDGWAYVWPRDAAAAALALNAAGYRSEARRVARFLAGLDLGAAARFDGDGNPVPGRAAEGDAIGWVAVAIHAIRRSGGGLAGPSRQLSAETSPGSPQDLPDYQEKEGGDYLGNALAAAAVWTHRQGGTRAPLHGGESFRQDKGATIGSAFRGDGGLARRAGDPASGLDSAAAWAVEPFPRPSLHPAARRTMLVLVRRSGRFGATPGTAWPGRDPWSAPTAWTAWSLAALARRDAREGRAGAARQDRRLSLRLIGDLRRAATPAGTLPERVDTRSGIPRSTTPLAWSHAFAILALRELWPRG